MAPKLSVARVTFLVLSIDFGHLLGATNGHQKRTQRKKCPPCDVWPQKMTRR